MTTARVERRLAAILAADVVGYSRLMGEDETGTLARLKAHRKELLEPLLAEHHGRIVKLMGDGVLCEFGSVVDAVACAVAIQRGMAERETGVAEDQKIRFRIGINTGDVIIEGDDIYGDGVNVAARLEGLAEPGGICVSGRVREEIARKLAIGFAPMGQQRIKNIAEPIDTWRVVLDGHALVARKILPRRPGRVWAAVAVALALLLVSVAAAGAWWWLGREDSVAGGGSPPLPDRPSVAVLPFEASGEDAAQQRLADGFTVDLITELSRFPMLFVTAPNSIFAYKGRRVDNRQVGRELGVHYVLEGSLERQEDRLRVSARLVEAATGGQIWSDRYDRAADDLFAVRDEVLTQLIGGLTGYEGPMWRSWAEAARRKPTGSLTAWDYYLMTREPLRRGVSRDSVHEAMALLEQAIAIDPRFARAWASLADYRFLVALNGWAEDPARSWELFHAAARTAAELDPRDGWAQYQLGRSYFGRGEAKLGAEAWDRALALEPNSVHVIRQIGNELPIMLGVERAAQAVELAERALRLDPLHPSQMWLSLGIPLYFAGRYDEAAAAIEKIEKHWLESRLMLAVSYAQGGQQEKAAAQAAEMMKLEPGFTAEAWVENDFYQPGSSSAARLIEGARKAGLPVCATAEVAAKFEPGNRLPECEAERAKVAAPKT
jgi:TolB-like protein/class 3 adenylate cyclase/tetratricopeptide (TPR) repeat protein